MISCSLNNKRHKIGNQTNNGQNYVKQNSSCKIISKFDDGATILDC